MVLLFLGSVGAVLIGELKRFYRHGGNESRQAKMKTAGETEIRVSQNANHAFPLVYSYKSG